MSLPAKSYFCFELHKLSRSHLGTCGAQLWKFDLGSVRSLIAQHPMAICSALSSSASSKRFEECVRYTL